MKGREEVLELDGRRDGHVEPVMLSKIKKLTELLEQVGHLARVQAGAA